MHPKRSYCIPLAACLIGGWLASGCGGDLNQAGSYRKLPKETTLDGIGEAIAEARVIKVADGDTLTVSGSDGQPYKIRLHAIDSPEKKQSHGERCTQHLQNLAQHEVAQVEIVDLDRYKRVVGKVWVDGQDVGLAQIQQGCAWHYKTYAGQQSSADRRAYAQAEQQARQQQMGLWRAARPLAPWDYRRRY